MVAWYRFCPLHESISLCSAKSHQVLHERRRDLEYELNFLLDYGGVVFGIAVLILCVVFIEFLKHIGEFLRTTTVLDESAESGQLILK